MPWPPAGACRAPFGGCSSVCPLPSGKLSGLPVGLSNYGGLAALICSLPSFLTVAARCMFLELCLITSKLPRMMVICCFGCLGLFFFFASGFWCWLLCPEKAVRWQPLLWGRISSPLTVQQHWQTQQVRWAALFSGPWQWSVLPQHKLWNIRWAGLGQDCCRSPHHPRLGAVIAVLQK